MEYSAGCPALYRDLTEKKRITWYCLQVVTMGEILHIAENALSGAQCFQLHTATGTGASANGVRKVVVTPPRMSAFGADIRAVRPFDCVMLEAVAESVCPLFFGQSR